jgi:hypothetical protein
MRRLRPYLPLALLLVFVVGSRPQCDQRAGTEAYAPVALRLPGNTCTELVDPTGMDWSDLASATLADTFASIWLHVERRATGNRVFVCASNDVPLQTGLPVPIDVVRDTGDTGRGVLNLDTGDVVEVIAIAVPPTLSEGDSAQLQLAVHGGTAPYTFRWVGNVSDAASPNPTVYAPGRYYVWVFDNEADDRTVPLHYDWTMVEVGAMPVDTFATASPDTIDPGGSTRLGITPAPRSAWWSPNTDLDNPYTPTPLATPRFSTKYTAVAIFDGPQNLTKRVNVRMSVDATANPASITPEQYSVVRATGITGGHEEYWRHTFIWSPAEGLDTVFGQSRVARPSRTTTYTVRMIDAYGQMATDTVTVEVTP